jgi:hypothetical protein
MFGKSAKDAAAEKVREEERYFRRQLTTGLTGGTFTLALSRMVIGHEFSFRPEMSGGPRPEFVRHFQTNPGAPTFYGVVHDPYGRSNPNAPDKWMRATLRVGGTAKPSTIGSLTLQCCREPSDAPPLTRQIQMEVWLSDETSALLTVLTEALRDRAISGDQFCHVELGTEKTQPDQRLEELESGSGYFMLVVDSVRIVRDVTLPKAPKWSWSWSWDE